MDDDADFVDAIQANPGDMDLRRIYADWLLEREDPRGQYLRLTLQLHQISERLARLREEIHPTWMAAIAAPAPHKGTFHLHSGRSIHLTSLRQFLVYAGFIECSPNTHMNRRLIEKVVQEERERWPGKPYLIEPEERLRDYDPDLPFPFNQPAELPGVCCVGEFKSYQSAAGWSGGDSILTIIWFQNEFAFPIADDVVAQLATINWRNHAVDYDLY